jgi:BRCT domain, a BRCA1 C-terminus domain
MLSAGAPEPTRTFFDPFHSSSSGHQRAENSLSGSTSWRDSRSRKLAQQFRDSTGAGGNARLAGLVGAGSENFGKDERKVKGSYGIGPPRLRERGLQDIRGFIGSNKKKRNGEMAEGEDQHCKRKKNEFRGDIVAPAALHPAAASSFQVLSPKPSQSPCFRTDTLLNSTPKATPPSPRIFRSLTLYLNGSTLSSGISDHKLKSLFVQHGGSISIALGRRTVTHVVLGSCGGGIAAGKIQREVAKVGGVSVKYVTVKWVVDSIECGKRLPESRYQALHTAMRGQESVLGKLAVKKQ